MSRRLAADRRRRLRLLCAWKISLSPLSVAHQDQFPASTISFDLAEGYSLGGAVKMIAEAEAAVGMPSSIVGVFSADAAEFNKSLASEPWLILAAIVSIYILYSVFFTKASPIPSPC